MFRAPMAARSSYLRSISSTVHRSPSVASLGSANTGWSRCGIPSYVFSSIRLGSTIKNLTISGEDLYRMLRIIELRATLFPVPVAPAMSRWGILDKSVTTGLPTMFFPSAIARGEDSAT